MGDGGRDVQVTRLSNNVWSFGWGKQRPCSYWLAQGQGWDEADKADTDLLYLDLGLQPERWPLTLINWPLDLIWYVLCCLGCVPLFLNSLPSSETTGWGRFVSVKRLDSNAASPELCDSRWEWDEREEDWNLHIFFTLKKLQSAQWYWCGDLIS